MALSREEALVILDAQVDSLISFCSPLHVESEEDTELRGGWKYVKESNGIRVYEQKLPSSPVMYMKGTTTIATPPEEVMDFLWLPQSRQYWDDMFIEGKTVEGIDDSIRVEYLAIKSPTRIVSDRDFCILQQRTTRSDNTLILAAVSHEHEKCPEVKDRVRADIQSSGMVVRPHPQNNEHTCIQYVACVDSKGWIPVWLNNLVSVRQPMALTNLRQELESRKK